MTRFLLIRHALTDSVGKRLSGRSSGLFLNDEGRKQAQYLAERLSKTPINAIYSSPLERALETAQLLARSLNLTPILSEDFLEIDFGKWTNCTIDELKSDPQFQLFNTFRSATRIPGGEMMPEAQLRIVAGIEKLRVHYSEKTVAIISHADLIKSAIAYYSGISLDMIQRIEISPASVSIVELYDETARIVLLNETGKFE